MFDWFFKKKEQPELRKSPAFRGYQGAINNRLTSDWVSSGASADSEILGSLRPLRNRSRDLCRNNDYAKGAVRTIVNNVVGKGLTLQAQVKKKRGGDDYDDPLNALIEDAWKEWSEAQYCHVSGRLCFADIERLVIRSLVESGEVLVRLVKKSFAKSPIPLALEVIEADQLCDDWSSGHGDGTNVIRMGVELDQWLRPVAYHLYPYHPGDYLFGANQIGGRINRVEAAEVLHLFICDRPGQTRGVPWFHAALMRLRNMGGYEQSELIAARAQASVMGFIQSPDGDLFGQGVENENRLFNLEPGAIEVLAPGETFAGFAPSRPNQGFDPFVRMMLRGVAASLGLSYESLSRDYSNTSYSSARTSLIEERDNYRILQDWLIANFHRPIYKQWVELGVLSGRLNLKDFERSPNFYLSHKWTPRGWLWVDPQSEVAANKEAIKAGFTSLSQVVAQTGGDVEDILKDRKREIEIGKKLGIGFDTTIEASPEGEAGTPQDGFTPTRAFTPIPYRERKEKTGKKGISCGNACISASKTCTLSMSPQLKEKKGGLKKKLAPKRFVYQPTAKAGTLAEINPAEILADPKRFQYKIIGEHTQSGSVGSLSGVKKYDANLAGIVQVWEDPADGKTYVVNGHNRLDLAKRLGAEKVAVRYLDVKDAKEARAVGAITNIAEGRGNALDAAKFFKDSGMSRDDLQKKGIPMREAIAQQGIALSQLEDSLFRKVLQGDISINRGAIIGGAGLTTDQQLKLHELAEKESKKRSVTDAFLSELADTVKSSSESSGMQFDLFGGSQVVVSNAIEKASLQAQIKKRLSREKKLFGLVSKSKAAQELEKAGNVINQAASKDISKEAASTLQLFDQFKNLSGPISKALNSGADRILAGESAKKVEEEIYNEIKKHVEAMVAD